MAIGPIGAAVREMGRLFDSGSAAGLGDGELLRRFASRRDPAAMEGLVARHGPMVLGVCRRVLGPGPDVEDAFQAVFLVLVRKAGTIRDPDLLGPWLHGVAHRVAVRSRANSARRLSKERPGVEAEEAIMGASAAGDDFVARAELRAVIDEEIARLPEKFRLPVVLCYLEGKTHDEAALRLKCPVGTVRSRLASARERLQGRLGRRGVAVAAGAIASVLAADASAMIVARPLLDATVSAAIAFAAGGAGATLAGMVPAGAASLADGVSTTMFLGKMKLLGALVATAVLTIGVGGATARQFAATGPNQEPAAKDQDAIDQTLAKLREQTKDFEAQIKALQAKLAKVEAERDNLRRGVEIQGAASLRPSTSPPGAALAAPAAPAAPPAPPAVPFNPGVAAMPAGGTPVSPARGGLGGLARAEAPFDGGFGGRMGGTGGMGGMGGMGGGGMGGMMGGARAGGRSSLATLQNEDYIIVARPDTGKVSAYSTETGDWVSYDVPKGVKVTPIASGQVVTLMAEGETIPGLAAFVPRTGRWVGLDLKEPAKGRAAPVVSQGLAVFTVDNHVYAFSARRRGGTRWTSKPERKSSPPSGRIAPWSSTTTTSTSSAPGPADGPTSTPRPARSPDRPSRDRRGSKRRLPRLGISGIPICVICVSILFVIVSGGMLTSA